MDSVAVSRRNQTNRKGNKENTQPAQGPKSFIRRDKTSAAPFQLKSNDKEETLAKKDPCKEKPKQAAGEALKKVKVVQRDGVKQTHSQALLTEPAAKLKKVVAEAPKPTAAVQSSKSAPGMYKGKIIQSKIGSIWKASASVGAADPKQEGQNVAKHRSKSVSEMPGRGSQKPVPTRSKSVSERSAQMSKPAPNRPAQMSKPIPNRPAQVSKPATSSRRPAGFCSARPPTRTIPATLTATSSRNTTAASTKPSGTQSSKPKIPVTNRKVSKPPVSSTLSQYRFTMETAEERKAKLAEWLASKGKSLKRPALTAAGPSKAKTSAKPTADFKPKPQIEPQPAAQREPEQNLEAHGTGSAAAHCDDARRTEPTVHGQTPIIMNTTLDLLENSDADLPVDPQDRVDDIVVNLCDALEAMATPSRCSDVPHMTDECDGVEMESSKPVEESKQEELKNETPEDVGEQSQAEQVKDKVEECDDQKVKTEDAEEEEESDDDVMETTPQREDASKIKYSVKTTPYLQSVKKTIEDEASTSTSKRKSNIKDLKFLTPVRRSCRIERKSSRLPSMLVDHDPCVSSLAELVKLDDDANAYIYRKNDALLEDLPDEPRL
ncbi:cytoskeleton-associated protein 2 isoform X2 [Stegastes partitus]|uniref:Cytoskeleton-associated protein 2 isoform X2 n=1 Tax=Stegastes partitus TaxID=144197 RepID=A0A9Y4K9P7_9TELE|nr:PREDICTED: cytoskeleton-associated protein 2-like isoform X2 [Stegastes partitus]